MRKIVFSSFFFILLSHTLMAQDKVYSPARFGRAATPADEDQIIELMDSYSMGMLMGDARMVASNYTENASFMSADSDLIYGRTDIKAFLTQYFQESGTRDETSGARISFRYLEDKVAVYHSFTRGTDSESSPEEAFPETHSTFVLHKTADEGWKIVHHMIMNLEN